MICVHMFIGMNVRVRISWAPTLYCVILKKIFACYNRTIVTYNLLHGHVDDLLLKDLFMDCIMYFNMTWN